MSDTNGNGVVQKAVNSALLTLVARGAMIVAAAALPFIGTLIWNFGNRIVEKVDSTSSDLRDLKTDVKYRLEGVDNVIGGIGGIRHQLNDHEGRIRVIEGRPPIPRLQ